jgi:hypothetical protein
MAVTFDGPNLRINLSAIEDLDAQIDLYEAWKQWVLVGDNAKFPPAFDTIGGDAIGATTEVSPYFFLRNDLGWKIKAPEATGTINIEGNLFGRSASTGLFVSPSGAYTVMFNLLVSSRGTVSVVSTGSGLSSTQDQRLSFIEKILRNKMITDPTTGVATLFDDDGVTPLASAELYESTDTSQPYRGRGIQRRERTE